MVSIVIGSWGSYNECNERALGSKWIDLSDYESWEEIEEELKALSLHSLYEPQDPITILTMVYASSNLFKSILSPLGPYSKYNPLSSLKRG